MNKLLLHCFTGWLIAFCVNAKAQNNINFTSITVNDGLPANTVNAILQDRYGMMWFGTTNGLCRYDGSNFTVYRHDADKIGSLPANEVLSLLYDHNGRLWVGTSSAGVCYYDNRSDSFVKYKGDGSWPEIDHISVRALCEDHRGNIWVATYGALFTTDPKTGKIIRRHLVNKLHTADLVALSLHMDKVHRVWIGTNQGLYLYQEQANTFTQFLHNDADPNSLSSDIIKSIAEDAAGNLWFGTFLGLNKWVSNNFFANYKSTPGQKGSLSNDAIFALYPDMSGKLWVGTEDGVNIFDPNTHSFVKYEPDTRNVFSLKGRSIRSIFIDPKGIYWVGTFGAGISKYNRELVLFNLKQANPFDKSALRSSIITSFADARDGKVFVGTDGGGVVTFNSETGLFSPINLVSRLKNNRDGLTVLSLHADQKKQLWVGTYHDGLFCVDPANGKYQQFTASTDPTNLNHNNITSITEDHSGNIWIGTLGGGINIYNPANGTFSHFSQKSAFGPLKKRSPLNDYITSITCAANGDMWIASMGSGVIAYHVNDGNVSYYTKQQNDLADNVVQNLFISKDGTVWAGTNQGLSFLKPLSNKFISYSEKQGLANGLVKTILEDNSGLIWLTTDRGISSFDRYKGTFRNFSGENGVQPGSFISNAGLTSANGDLYFGGEEGMNYFRPQLLPAIAKPGRVFLTDLKVNNFTVVPGEGSPIKETIGLCKEITLKYGQNFSISYVALDYASPKQNRYAYKLQGFDKDWNYVHQTRVANYTNIDPGNYVFKVRASNTDKFTDQVVTEVHVAVLPPFWRTEYAYVCYFLAICGALFLIRQRGINKLKSQFAKEQEALQVEQFIAEERREAERLHELDLLKIKFLTDLSHEFRTPIALIAAPVDKLLGRKFEKEVTEDLNMVSRNARRLLNLVNQLLDFRKMEENELKLNLTAGDVIGFINETADSFKDVAARKQIALQVMNTPEHWNAFFDREKLERIIFNLMSNAFKFTESGGTITLTTEININDTNPIVRFTITDTGVGIKPQEINKIFDRFYQAKQASSILNQGTGIGLSITKEFVELHGGSIRAEALPERGMRFSVELPLEPATESNALINSPHPTEVPALEEQSESNKEDMIGTTNKKTTILLVEDNDEFRQYLAKHLVADYHIIEAANGKEGWQKTLSAHPQLVVSDISMPEMNGIDLSKKIKADKRTCHIPVILLTAIAGEENQLKGLESGASDYLTKPFSFEILNVKINNILNLNNTLKNTYSKQVHMVGQQLETESTDVKLISTIIMFIESKMSDPNLSVEELSKHVGMSRGSLYYKIIELTGTSPVEYIRTIKLEKAAALLETSDYNVAQIAYTTGFGTPSYFSRMFKSKYGMLPSEYLNEKRAKRKGKSISDGETT